MKGISLIFGLVLEIRRCLSINRVEFTDDGWSDGGLADDCWLAWSGSCLLRAHDMRIVVIAVDAVAGEGRRHLILVYSPEDVFHRGRLHMMQNSSLSY